MVSRHSNTTYIQLKETQKHYKEILVNIIKTNQTSSNLASTTKHQIAWPSKKVDYQKLNVTGTKQPSL